MTYSFDLTFASFDNLVPVECLVSYEIFHGQDSHAFGEGHFNHHYYETQNVQIKFLNGYVPTPEEMKEWRKEIDRELERDARRNSRRVA